MQNAGGTSQKSILKLILQQLDISRAADPKLLHFKSGSETDSCDECQTSKDGSKPTKLQKLNGMGLLGRSTCALLYSTAQMLVSSALGKVSQKKIRVTSERDGDDVRLSFGLVADGNVIRHYEFLTLPGAQECSLRSVHTRRNLHKQRKDQYLPVLKMWLEKCTLTHQCSNVEGPFPTRVLDVGIHAVDPVRLYISKAESGCYIALSHCWGGMMDNAARTTIQSLPGMTRGITMQKLSKNFVKAIEITRELGVQYLWYGQSFPHSLNCRICSR